MESVIRQVVRGPAISGKPDANGSKEEIVNCSGNAFKQLDSSHGFLLVKPRPASIVCFYLTASFASLHSRSTSLKKLRMDSFTPYVYHSALNPMIL